MVMGDNIYANVDAGMVTTGFSSIGQGRQEPYVAGHVYENTLSAGKPYENARCQDPRKKKRHWRSLALTIVIVLLVASTICSLVLSAWAVGSLKKEIINITNLNYNVTNMTLNETENGHVSDITNLNYNVTNMTLNETENGQELDALTNQLHSLRSQILDLQNGFTRVRLQSGWSNEGRVEILHNGTWGTICDEGWDNTDAGVVCRMLGYDRAYAYCCAIHGEGSGPIWLSGIGCDGTENNIASCKNLGWGNHSSCTHNNDASVYCI
ncbi:uncharacterized protein LOC120329374 [Styela clava]